MPSSKFCSNILHVLQGLHDESNLAFHPEFFVTPLLVRILCEKEPRHKKNQWPIHSLFHNEIGKYYFYDTLPPRGGWESVTSLLREKVILGMVAKFFQSIQTKLARG